MASAESGASLAKKLDELYEFEREPVSEAKLQSGRHFAALFAGEHVAATEFVIGALFVSEGAGAFDVVVGLVIGNLLAVLSWAFVCAPIAVETRLTLYWYLRRLAGPTVTVLYNVLNAVLYCILAGAMITVSASAVRVPFGIEPQTGWVPSDPFFVPIVLLVGAVVVTLAILGFKRLAQFATVCSPWMFIIFIAGALATLPALGEIGSFGDFWRVAQEKIWTGPAPGREAEALGFWHIVSFAWICNLAMHLGLSDMAIFRYAKRSSYGFYSAFGMYLGHYLAWICAGVMGAAAAAALQPGHPVPEALGALDAGGVAYYAAGIAGLVAVVIAGWTTSNPTLYRAGLALQVVTPGWPRWLVTLIAGAVTTIIACFPFVFRQLLDFVGVYGILLMPVGAIVVLEHWVFPRIGWKRFWAEGRSTNVPALVAWLAGVAASVILWKLNIVHLFFLLVPVWVLTSVIYLALAYLWGAKDGSGSPDDAMASAADAIVAAAQGTVGPGRGEPGARAEPGRAEPGARAAPGAGSSPPAPSPGSASVGPSRPGRLERRARDVALLALVACLALPVWVFLGGSEAHAERFGPYKSWLLVASAVYFVASVVWISQRGEDEPSGVS